MKKTIVFDIDDTLTDNSWLRLNTAAGLTGAEDYALYRAYVLGEFDYREWTNHLADLYRQHNLLTEKIAREVLGSYSLKADAQKVVTELKQRGYDVILITGGFDLTAQHLGIKLGLTNYFATSKLEFDNVGRFTNMSTVTDDGEAKVELLKKYLLQTGKSAESCIAIGDSSNDIPLFNFTKNGITFDWSKDQVRAAASHRISALSELLLIL